MGIWEVFRSWGRTHTGASTVPAHDGLGWHQETMPPGLRRSDEQGVYQWSNGRGLLMPMVYVPPGEFWRGSDIPGAFHCQPKHRCRVTRGFYIGQYLVTRQNYELFVKATGYRVSCGDSWRSPDLHQTPDHPVVYLAWRDVVAFWEWAGLRLPSEAEWEYAARGSDGREYPWGNGAPSDRLLCWSGENVRDYTSPVGQHPAGASPFGAFDMSGLVWEWTADWFGPYEVEPGRVLVDPEGPSHGTERAMHGCCYSNRSPEAFLAAGRVAHSDGDLDDVYGFRCAL